MGKERLDILLVERGLCPSRTLAQKLILGGSVRVNDEPHFKPSEMIDLKALILLDAGPRFVSRGGEKLQAAMDAFHPDVAGRLCADVGASTGGFTDCLLQAGAARVYAIDVGYGQIALKLRNDSRVVLMERTNARFVETLPDSIYLAAIDASFISLRILLPVVLRWLDRQDGRIIALVKPQFEAGQKTAGRGRGVILDEAVHQEVVRGILDFSVSLGLSPSGLIYSPLTGPKGNREFLVQLEMGGTETASIPQLLAECFKMTSDMRPPLA
jgi:23S rRNA (cytidine1920-2'-O)/16S rRNA (cytidine1409-2'-O)-methyltransferase